MGWKYEPDNRAARREFDELVEARAHMRLAALQASPLSSESPQPPSQQQSPFSQQSPPPSQQPRAGKQSLHAKAAQGHLFQSSTNAVEPRYPSRAERALAVECLATAIYTCGSTNEGAVFKAAQAHYTSALLQRYSQPAGAGVPPEISIPSAGAFRSISRAASEQHAAASIDAAVTGRSSREAARAGAGTRRCEHSCHTLLTSAPPLALCSRVCRVQNQRRARRPRPGPRRYSRSSFSAST